ncbi:hypothetical protein BDA99DRAFT_448323, partial [Phascolomyces articulosus]
GLPTHRLVLKENMPIMLIRNINQEGLCNGARLIYYRFTRNQSKQQLLPASIQV